MPSSYYVAFAGSAASRQSPFVVGNGVPHSYRGVTYPNPPPEMGVDHYIFIRLYSSDVSLSVIRNENFMILSDFFVGNKI